MKRRKPRCDASASVNESTSDDWCDDEDQFYYHLRWLTLNRRLQRLSKCMLQNLPNPLKIDLEESIDFEMVVTSEEIDDS